MTLLNIDGIIIILINESEVFNLKKVNVYLDDWRIAPKGWIQVWNVEGLIDIFENPEYEVHKLSLDNDLGVDEHNVPLLEGVDFIKIFIERGYTCHKIFFHTSNPIAKQNMIFDLESAKKHGIISDKIGIVKVGYPKSDSNRGQVFNDLF